MAKRSRLERVKNWAELAKAANYNVERLAEECGVSVRQLENFFRRKTGLSPHEWLTQARQMEALGMVHQGKRIKDVAEELGYTRATNFSRDFRHFHGIPPTLARKASVAASPHQTFVNFAF
jgi:AraC-like DNA-binding protein